MPGTIDLPELLLPLLAGAWLAAAAWATWRGRRLAAEAAAVLDENARLSALVQAGSALPLLIHRDGRLDGQDRLGTALGVETPPDRWAEFLGAAFPSPEQADELARAVQDAATGGRFAITLR